MMLLQRDQKSVTLIKQNGKIYEDIKANIQSNVNKVITQDTNVIFEEGDCIERKLPNGLIEKFCIVKVNYSQNFVNMDIKKIVNNDSSSIHREITTREVTNKVFIVHGHDNEAKVVVARVLEKAGFEAIILHEQPNLGKTIMEKLEKYTDVDYAIVLYTECDKGRAKDEKVEDEKYRARQNVVYEHGYLIGKLGREKVFALVKGNVETPGDISGVVYTEMDDLGAWKMTLAKDMKEIGLPVDMNQWV